MLPRSKLCIYGGFRKMFCVLFTKKIFLEAVTHRAAQPKQKSKLPPGA